MEKYLQDKIDFVDRLNTAIKDTPSFHISRVYYDIVTVNDFDNEFLVIEFVGGALSVRNCNMNSCTAILREFGNMCDGGYYDELEYYNALKERVK